LLLALYFPEPLRREFASHFDAHPLKREIIGTVAVNHIVNTAGIAFVRRAMKETEKNVGEVFAAFYRVANAGDAEATRKAILSESIDVAARHAKLLAFENALAEKVVKALAG